MKTGSPCLSLSVFCWHFSGVGVQTVSVRQSSDVDISMSNSGASVLYTDLMDVAYCGQAYGDCVASIGSLEGPDNDCGGRKRNSFTGG